MQCLEDKVSRKKKKYCYDCGAEIEDDYPQTKQQVKDYFYAIKKLAQIDKERKMKGMKGII